MPDIKVIITGGIESINPDRSIADNCIKFYEGFYEISIAIENNVRIDMRVFKKTLAIKNDNYSIECTGEFFKSEYKKSGYIYYTNQKLIKAIKLARKLSNEIMYEIL